MVGETYSDLKPEDVSSLMRIEKASGQLSEVRRDLYPAMLALQESIARQCDNKDVESFDHDLLVDRKRKLNSNIKLVVEYRMNKVAAMALRGAMGTLNVVDNLPPEERLFYEECLESAKKLWNAPHKRKKNVYVPDIIPETKEGPETPAVETPAPAEEVSEPVPPIDEGPTEMEGPPDDVPVFPEPGAAAEPGVDIPPIPEEELGEGAPAEAAPATETEPEKEEEASDENPYADCFDMVTVRMTETVEPFAGTERNYSLKKEDVVRLPKSLASILVGRKLAVILNI